MRLNREFFVGMLQATMQEICFIVERCGDEERATLGDRASFFEFAVYVTVLIQLFGGLCLIG